MDPPQTTGTSVSSGSCFSTLPSGLLPSMTSLEACTSWLLGVTQSPPVDSRPVTGVPLPPQSCVMSSWSVNSSNSLGRPISQQPGSVGNFPSAQPIQAVPVPAGYPVYDQSFHRPPYQPQADFFNSFLLPLHLEGEGVRFMPLLLRVVLTLKDGQRSSLKQILLFWLRTS